MAAASGSGAPLQRRVLVVDDDADFSDSLVDILEPADFAAWTASDPGSAVAALAEFAPHVVLLDIRLGLTSGMDLLSRLRAEKPDLVCVMMTAHAETQSAIEALRSGAYDYFDKTCAPSELLAVLARCFEKLQLQEERRAAYEALRAAKEEAEVANRAKSEFLATISHELRTPLNAVIGFSEMMMLETLGPMGSPQYVDHARDIHSAGSHLLAIINDILDLSKAEAGKLDLMEGEVDVAEAIAAVWRIMRPRAEQAGLTLAVAAPRELPTLYADERKLKQMLMNLASNAIKFTPKGGHVALAVSVEAERSFTICVRDSGIGIAKENLEKVLQPFVQIDSALNRRHAGTGLGLPLVAAMMELHGGKLLLESAPGEGTAAALVFPWRRVVPPAMEAVEPGGRAVRRADLPDSELLRRSALS